MIFDAQDRRHSIEVGVISQVCLALTSSRLAKIVARAKITLPTRISADSTGIRYLETTLGEMNASPAKIYHHNINTVFHQTLMQQLQDWMPRGLVYHSFCGTWKKLRMSYNPRVPYKPDLGFPRMSNDAGHRDIYEICHCRREAAVIWSKGWQSAELTLRRYDAIPNPWPAGCPALPRCVERLVGWTMDSNDSTRDASRGSIFQDGPGNKSRP